MLQNKPGSVEINLPLLTDSQKKAVFTLTGPILGDAVPGSGKTRTITSRAAYLTACRDVSSILAITFTKAARTEMRERTDGLIQNTDVSPKITNFHSFTYHLLKELRGVKKLPVVEPQLIFNRAKTICRQMSGGDASKLNEKTLENYLGLISRAKSEGLLLGVDRQTIASRFDKWLTGHSEETDADFIISLWDRLNEWYGEHNLLDFDDLLNQAVEDIKANPAWRLALHRRYRHIMIDEFQDTNPPQWALIRSIVENRVIETGEAKCLPASEDMDWTNRSLLVCGDGDQSIYGFRSADISNILGFSEVYRNCLVVELKTNYRSSSTITACANDLIISNPTRRPKVIEAIRPHGNPIGLLPAETERDMVESTTALLFELYNEKREIGVLARHHDSLDLIREECAVLGIPTETLDGVPFSELGGIINIRRWLTAACDLHNSGKLLASLAEIGEQERWQERRRRAELFGISLFELIRQEVKLNERETELLHFLLRISKLLTSGGYSEVLELCLNRSGLITDLADSNDPLKNGRLVDVVNLFSQTKTIEDAAADADGCNAFLNLFEKRTEPHEQIPVKLMTVHASKGLEFDTVIVIDANDGIMPDFFAEDAEEEVRIFYVALTRAVNRLVYAYNRHNPSRYLKRLVELKKSHFIRLDKN